MKEKKYFAYLHWIWFTQKDLLDIFWDGNNNPKDIFDSLTWDILKKLWISEKRGATILKRYAKINTKKLDEIVEKLKVELIIWSDKNYLENLKNIFHPPFLLYVRWKIPSQKMFWVVGARKITPYWKQIIANIVPEVSKTFTIVSWWAAGCDAYAHKAAIDVWNKTVIVLGTGINQCYPVSHAELYNTVAESHGAVISIFPIWEPWNPYNFPVRNEIVTGLSEGILVIEAQEKSWSLITANLALDLGKELFSIPGNIFHTSSNWCNLLIKNGSAKCVTNALDILEEYNIEVTYSKNKQILETLSRIEKQIYTSIWEGNYDIYELSEKLDLSSSELAITLSLLELKWIIKKELWGKYIVI